MEEIRYFGRLSLFALIVGVGYWFVSYDPAGTVMLVGFGVATGAGFTLLRSGARYAPEEAGEAEPYEPDGPFGDESGPLPTRSAAPLAVGFGVAVIGLAGAFGPWFILAGAVPLLLGAADWLRAANRELALRERLDEPGGGEGDPAAAAAPASPPSEQRQAAPGPG
jgi:Cytochrome c oxidase subunit IV